MTYAERFFVMMAPLMVGEKNGIKYCAPLANGEFNTALEPSFINNSIQERANELLNAVYDEKPFPSWYVNACERITSRLGGETLFPVE
jgi:hypothetical protein